jgi:hypothetical protein
LTAGGLVIQHVRTAMKTCRLTPSSLLSLIVFSITALSVAAEMHTWTNLTGQQIQGEMTGMDVAARAVKVRRKDGLEFNLPIANLSAEDIAYASALWRQMQANGAVPAAAAAAPAAPPGSVLNLKLLPPRFIARTSAATRLAAIRSNGGDDRIEAAVVKSLDRLKTVQKPFSQPFKKPCSSSSTVRTSSAHGPMVAFKPGSRRLTTKPAAATIFR